MDWSKTCYICNQVSPETLPRVRSIVPLMKYPSHACVEDRDGLPFVRPEYIHEYPVCEECLKRKELV